MNPLPRITILGLNYAPEQAGIAPYTSSLATEVSKLGFSVKVITSLPHYPAWIVSDSTHDLIGTHIENNVEVCRVKHFIPGNPNFFSRFLSELSFGIKSTFNKWASPNVLILVSPGLFSSVISLMRAKLSRRRIRVVVWVQDLYGEGLEQLGGNKRISSLLKKFESFVLSQADQIVVPHELFVSSLEAQNQKLTARCTVVRNWSHLDKSNSPGRSSPLTVETGETVVLHTGNMGAKQGLDNVVKAARLAHQRGLQIKFVLVGDGTERRALIDDSKGLGNIEFLPPVNASEYLALLNSADLLLVNERPGVSTMSVPSKLTSYFFSGKPIIAATDGTGTTAAEITAAGAGEIVQAGDPQALLNKILEMMLSPELNTERGKSGIAYATEKLSTRAAIQEWVNLINSPKRAGDPGNDLDR